jgi:hypothetical protein
MNTDNRINYNNVLPDLQDFMLTSKIIVNALSNRLLIEHNKNVKPIHTCKSKPESPSIFIPKQQDSLFVCFYKIINKDIDDKEHITFTTEKNLKIEYVDKLRKNKEIVKKHKFASITHIENQLVNENKIDINTFLTLCVIENINIIYIHNKIYYELLINPESVCDNIHIIHFFDKLTKYGYEGHSQDKIINYKQTLFKVDNINKPLKAISFYKIQDLIDTCNKLAIDIKSDTNKPKLKKDLYELIIKSL